MTDRVQYLLQNLLTADGVPGLQMVMAVTADGMLRAHAYRDHEAADRAAAEDLQDRINDAIEAEAERAADTAAGEEG
ncbi:MAG: hypothetical protein HC861_05955 [Rhodospirillaceae bacterium]|nr:hypothetical protein [Rhodospirillaceae bacterium]